MGGFSRLWRGRCKQSGVRTGQANKLSSKLMKSEFFDTALCGGICHLHFGHRLRSSAGGTTDFQAILPKVARPPGIPCQLCNVTRKKGQGWPKYSTAYFQITRTILKVNDTRKYVKISNIALKWLEYPGNAL